MPIPFDQSSLSSSLLASGPYVIADVKPGRSVTYSRNPPTIRAPALPGGIVGTRQFRRVRYDYYRDANSLFEAFKAGLYDVRIEGETRRAGHGLRHRSRARGPILRESLALRLPRGMSGFVFNTRRPFFADIRVRQASGYLFDFEWVNRPVRRRLYPDGQLFRCLRPVGRRPSGRRGERALLAPFAGAVRPDIMEGRWRPPVLGRLGPRPRHGPACPGPATRPAWPRRRPPAPARRRRTLAFEILVVARPMSGWP